MAKRKSKQSSPRSQALLAEKRRAAKILREAGLLRRRSGRIAKEYLQTSSHFRKLRREFADVLTGEVRVAKLQRDAAKLLRQAGYRVKQRGRRAVAVVPKETPKRLTPRVIQQLSINAPPKPPTPTRPTRREAHNLERCIAEMREWFLANGGSDAEFLVNKRGETYRGVRYPTSEATLERRWELLEQWIRRYPATYRRIVNASRVNAEAYLQGKTPVQRWPSPEEDEYVDLFKNEYPELYYYHPSAYTEAMTGALIPRC